MKSSYELAMERLEKLQPAQKLTKSQKFDIAEIESLQQAKTAEREVFLQGQIAKAMEAGNSDEIHSLKKQLAHEVRRIREDSESKKDRIRQRNET